MPPAVAARKLSRTKVADLYFMEHRAKLLDLAAFLDRYDRAEGDTDFRVEQLREALRILLDGKTHRSARILEVMSDPTTEPLAKAGGKGACGVYARSVPTKEKG